MKLLKCFFVLLLSISCFASEIPDMPMSSAPEQSLAFEWAQKEVLESTILSDMVDLSNWRHDGFGSMELSNVRSQSGSSSLLLTSPTKGTKPGPEHGRPFGACNAIFSPVNQDLTDWNRISFWVYPDLPGFKTVSLCMLLHNEGEEQVPDQYLRNGLNYMVLDNQQWNRVYWEIEHLGREKVTGIELRYRLQGNEPGATDTVRYYFDDLELQKVVPDYYEGWNVAPGQIAFSHNGYVNGFPKTALTSEKSIKQFSLVDVSTGREVLAKKTESLKTRLGKFRLLDFSEYTTPGTYMLKAGELSTKAFRIGSFADVYQSSVYKTINHYFCQRCGFEVPGIHAKCHRDWMCEHDSMTIPINGGWHDAGDLSQGLGNTSESAYSLLVLAYELKNTDPELSARLCEEARWGLDWIMNTRFGDGFRCNWGTMDFWTDGVLGNVDDMVARAWNNPGSNYMAARTQAMAAIVLKNIDPDLASFALQCAREDWEFAGKSREWRESVEHAAIGLNASLVLFKATGELKYEDKAIEYGDYILSCQARDNLATDVPLKGFFFHDPSKETILHYEHLGHEQDMVVGLIGLCELYPEHEKYTEWDNAIRLYVDYYKQIIPYTAPWNMIPAGVYDLEQARDDTEREQIINGVKLNDRYYLKNFPVWKTFRGNCGTVLSQTKGLSEAADYLDDLELKTLCYQQLQWVLGMNPFNQSLMYGEGYRFPAQYSAMSGNIAGGLPVGVQTHFNRDEPYWPTENCYNWKEIWVHPSGRWLWLMSDFYVKALH